MITAEDIITTSEGFWNFDVYEGDIVKDSEGRILNEMIDHFEGHNLIVTPGKQLILDRMFGLGGVGPITHMGVGGSTTAAAVGNTQLNTTPVLLPFDSTPTRSGLVVTCVRTFATGDANFSWNELGLFNGATNGTSTMLNRIAPIGPFNKTSAASIIVTATITQT